MSLNSSHGESSTSFLGERVARFKKLLNEERQAFLFDGGVATQLYEKGIFINRSFDEVNLSQADLISSIHKQYIQSGAQVITTNTWGANRIKLKNYGLDQQLFEISCKARKSLVLWQVMLSGLLVVLVRSECGLSPGDQPLSMKQKISFLNKPKPYNRVVSIFLFSRDLPISMKFTRRFVL
jgi:hypothetical protein